MRSRFEAATFGFPRSSGMGGGRSTYSTTPTGGSIVGCDWMFDWGELVGVSVLGCCDWIAHVVGFLVCVLLFHRFVVGECNVSVLCALSNDYE